MDGRAKRLTIALIVSTLLSMGIHIGPYEAVRRNLNQYSNRIQPQAGQHHQPLDLPPVSQRQSPPQRRQSGWKPNITYYEGFAVNEEGKHVTLRLGEKSKNFLRQETSLTVRLPERGSPEPTSLERLPFRIVQTSLPHTGSTVMANILVGLIEPPDAFMCYPGKRSFLDPCPDSHVLKTHSHNVKQMENMTTIGGADGVFFVSTNRGRTSIGRNYCDHQANVVCFEFEDLLYSNEDEMHRVVTHVADRIKHKFPYLSTFTLNETTAFRRLQEMERTTKQLENEPFAVYDIKFHVHGGHRNRRKGGRTKKNQS